MMFLLAALLVALCSAHQGEHECIHNKVQRLVDVKLQKLEYEHEKRDVAQADAGIPTAPLRVHFDTSHLTGSTAFECTQVGQTFSLMGESYVCEAHHIVSQATKNKIIRMLDVLRRDVADMLYIVRSSSFELDAYPWCFDPEHISTAAYRQGTRRTDLDALFFVTAWPSKSAAAWCGWCRLEQATGRPIAGHMNIAAGWAGGATDLEMLATLTHELFHGLGFESTRMQKQIRDGRLVSGVETITYGNAEDGTWTTDVLTSPNVVREARAHFNCPTLRGIPIEDYAKQIANEPGSHWDKFAMGFDVINPTLNNDDKWTGPRISRATLAYFADLGYYYPNYKAATPFTYGLGAGCSFLERPARFRDDYACKGNEMRCMPDLDAIGFCSSSTHRNCLTKWDQANTTDCHKGGSNPYSNYLIEAYPFKACSDELLDASWNGQGGGATSRCFMSLAAQRRSFASGPQGACYVTQCPVPGAAPEPEPAPEPAPVPQPPSQRNFATVTDCEECTEAGGVWCDQGWSSAYGRQGVCSASSSGCEAWQNRLTAANECYPRCTYNGDEGQCRSVPSCQRGGGAVFSSRSGANGCQREPSAVMCCIGHEGRKRAEPAAHVVEKRGVEQTRNTGVRVRVGNDWVTCPRDGGPVDVSGGSRTSAFTGTIDCPPLNDICCTHKNNCNNRGKCVRGFCACNKGWTGLECEREAEGPVLLAPSRRSWQIPPQYVMDLPSIDPPPPKEDDDIVLDQVPDGYGGLKFFASPDGANNGNGVAVDQTTVIIIVVVVVVVLVTAIGVGVGLFFLLRWRKNKTPTRA